MRRTGALAFALTLLALGALVAGCGAGATDDEQPTFITPAEVQQRFVEATGNGRLLRRAPVTDEAWVQLGPGLDPSAEVLERYGTFVVYVVKQGHGQAVASLMRGQRAGGSESGDELRWELDTLSDTWVANKRYGENVVLAWFSSRKNPALDARFERLDRILSGLTS